MGLFTARLGQSCSRSAARSAGAPPRKPRLQRAYKLPAKHVIHAVGPVWRGGNQGEPEQLASCYRRALELAREHGLRTVAFSAISCGVYGYPVDQAAAIVVGEVSRLLESQPPIETIYFVCFEPHVRAAYEATLREHAPR